MATNPTRCMRCEAPIPFQPGAGSRLCPFCGAVNLVREQQVAAPPAELKIDEVFRQYQNGRLQAALAEAERLMKSLAGHYRLAFYRACILRDLNRTEDAIFALIDLSGVDGPAHLRADAQALLADSLLVAGRLEEAQQAAERCLELQDGHPAGSLALALVRLHQGQGEEALRLTRDTLGRLERPWRVTFPLRRHELLLLQAEILRKLDRPEDCAQTLHDLLLTDTAAPLEAIRKAAQMLGQNYLAHALSPTTALELLRLAAMLDAENRHGMLDLLRQAASRAGADFSRELQQFKEAREELLAEIRSVLVKENTPEPLRPELIAPDLDLTLLGPDPDRRTDLLERAAERLQLPRFDRGTLYPLRTVEDFRRWVVAWRLRELVERLRRARQESDRLTRLKQVRGGPSGDPRGPHDPRGRAVTPDRPRRSWVLWLLSVLALGLILVVVFLILAGDRYLDHFEGNLIKVDCVGDHGGPPCTLHVLAGAAGRKRFRARHQAKSWPARLWYNWLDGRVQADGTILYPLNFSGFELDAGRYRKCIGRPIAKMRFTLAPLCNPKADRDR